MMFAFLAAAAAAVPKATPIDIASWFRPDDYPAEAAKKGIQGNATFEVDVDAEGKPTACRITMSSGTPILDQTTCDIVLKRARFKPAMRHGKPVPGRYSKRTRWMLDATPPPAATAIDPALWFSPEDYPIEAQKEGAEGKTTFQVDVDAEGKPTACRIIRSSGSPILDQTTCDIVRSKGRFKPAMSDGKPVPGQYSNTAVWRMPDPTAPGYRATILDFGSHPGQPECTIVSKGEDIDGPTCAQTMQLFQAFGAGEIRAKIVYLIAVAKGGEQPYRGEPAWGPRRSFVAIDLYYLKGTIPVACDTVAKEGHLTGADACTQFTGGGAPSEEIKRSARKARVEVSLFGVVPAAKNHGKCKHGESAGEVQGCAG